MSSPDAPIRIGISRCLLGDEVRHDGGHKRDAFLVDTFGRYVEWVPVCPEIEVGMGVPRDTLRLEAADAGVPVNGIPVRLVMPATGKDWTRPMHAWARRRAAELLEADLCGFILKSHSPSCGMERVRVHRSGGIAETRGRGLFAEALIRRHPNLPIEEEGRLSDPRLRENFVERVFAYRRLTSLFRSRWTVGALVRFHAAHKLTLLAHQPAAYTSLGRLVARAKTTPRADVRQQYEGELMAALKTLATPAKHASVLQHIVGSFKDRLDTDARDELLALIEEHRAGIAPLVVPLTLVRHHARRCRIEYLQEQTYLEPHPRELSLRNHV